MAQVLVAVVFIEHGQAFDLRAPRSTLHCRIKRHVIESRSGTGFSLCQAASVAGDGKLHLRIAEVTQSSSTTSPPMPVIACGFQSRANAEGQVADLVESVETRGPDGQRRGALSKDEIERYQGPAVGAYTFSTTLTMDPDNAAGTYCILLTARDMIGGGQVTQEAVFEFP